MNIDSTTSCVSLYHYRGHRKGGYFFALHIVAGYGQCQHIETNDQTTFTAPCGPSANECPLLPCECSYEASCARPG